jgi:para-aminobenzoate synthetase component 1
VPKYLFILKGDNLTIESYESKENLVEFYKKIKNIKHVESEKVKYDLIQRESKDTYLQKINMIKEHIQNGDIYEMNYCQEFFIENANCSPQDIYERLNLLAQSPFSCLLNLRNINIMCASPERFLKKTGSNILSQPIKGTSRRSEDPKEDMFLFEKLSNSVKDKTENVMIVDLVRNDLSMTAEKSSVKVDDLCSVYPFNQVYQMISTVSSKIDLTKYTFSDVLETNFPMGSMTGAPKHSAMRIIEKFEETKRGVFSGSVGYIDPDGDFDFNVIIRSIIYDSVKKYLSVSVGGAITNKSIDIEEYQECLTKATLMFNALNFNFDD